MLIGFIKLIVFYLEKYPVTVQNYIFMEKSIHLEQ